MNRPVLFWVQHLLGIGHQRRSAAIARACAAAGLEVHYISGGMPVPHLDLAGCTFHQLPPCRSPDDSFSRLVDDRDQPVSPAFWSARQSQLTKLITSLRPGLFMTETYPFGRRAFRHELRPVLEQVSQAGVNVASVRDILVRKPDPTRYAASADLIERHYAAVLVHEPDRFTGFENSFPFSGQIAGRLHKTGYVAEQPPRPGDPLSTRDPTGDIIISGGGSDVALPLYQAALTARRYSQQAGKSVWRILVGQGVSATDFQSLTDGADNGVIVERTRADFQNLLRRARASVSLAGYNTAIDGLVAGIPMLLVPFTTATETEQTDRARALADTGHAASLDLATITGPALAAGVDHTLGLPRQNCDPGWFRGAERSAEILGDLAAQHRE
ncbi:MAG: glycosyltransferase [Rhodospirillales bacterium]